MAQSKGGAQFYIACGQVKVTGGGGTIPRPTVKIPGVYTGNEPGILINIYSPVVCLSPSLPAETSHFY